MALKTFKAHRSLSYVSGDKMLWHFLCAFTFMVITFNYHCLGRIFNIAVHDNFRRFSKLNEYQKKKESYRNTAEFQG